MAVLLACLGLHLAWALAMPVTSAPDEPAHVYRAVSLWDGQLLPTTQHPRDSWLVRIPRSVPDYAESTACTRWRPDVPASCATPVSEPAGETTVGTAAGRYLPLYYAAIGWAGALDTTVTGFYAMRVLSLVGSSVLLALAVVTVLRTVGPRWAALALPVAVTPQVLWLGSAINPNAWEVDAGILTWAAGLTLVSKLSPETRHALWSKFLLGAAVLVLMRRLSPLWLVLIVAGVLAMRLCLPPDARVTLQSLATRRTAIVGAVLGGLVALSLWWHLALDLATVAGYPNPDPAPPGGFWATLVALVPDIREWLDETYGVFGWLDTFSPGVALFAWVALGSTMFALVVLGSERRRRIVLTVIGGLALCVLVPLAFGLTVGREVGIHFWQGRYTMPFAMGIPLALAVVGAGRQDAPAGLEPLLRLGQHAAWLMWPVLGTFTFVWAIHRYGSGVGGGWDPGSWSWSPPGGVLLLVAVHLAASILLVLSLRDAPAGQTRRRTELAPPAEAAVAGPRTR